MKALDDVGHVLYYTPVTVGLRQLCPDIHFDMGGSLNIWHPRISTHAGVAYRGKHICAIDRDEIPEFKVWSLVTQEVEVDPAVAAQSPSGRTTWRVVEPGSEEYQVGIEKAKTYDGGYAIEDGKLKHYKGFMQVKGKGRVIKVGWRHTFERIVLMQLPGLTRDSIGKKFGVDLNRFPMGSPEAVRAAIWEE